MARIKHTGKVYPKVDPKKLTEALGAEVANVKLLIVLSVPVARAEKIEEILCEALKNKLVTRVQKRSQDLEKITREGTAEQIKTTRFEVFGRADYGVWEEFERFLIQHDISVAELR
jgi:hypothetical protein